MEIEQAQAFTKLLTKKLVEAHQSGVEIEENNVACRIISVGELNKAEIVRSSDDGMKQGEQVELAIWDGKGADATWLPMFVDARRLELLGKIRDGMMISGFIMLTIDSEQNLNLVQSLVNV